MIAEINVFGVFVNAGLAAALLAGALLLGLRKLLTRTGAYQLAWHPALFDLALFVLLWALVLLVQTALESQLLPLLG